jgi:hypothetical protein
MAPFGIVAIVAAGLFIGGTIIKPEEPVLGTVMQGAGIGTLIGGGIGAAAGATGGVASFLGTTTAAATAGTAAVIGGASGTVAGAVVAPKKNRKPAQ